MLKLRFKAKANDNKINVPDFTSRHVFGPEHFNEISLKIELRRAYNRDPDCRPAKIIDLDHMPKNMTMIKDGFLKEFEIVFDNRR